MRLLVFGGWGQLGRDLASRAAERGHELHRPTHADVDVTDASAVSGAVAASRPDVVIDGAAFHQVDRCQDQPATAFAVNAAGAFHVARSARAAGARCVYIGTDYVVDGEHQAGYDEDGPVAPLNAYGVSKAAGERLVALGCPDWLVVRGSGMFGHAGSSGKGGNFVETMLAKAAAGERMNVVDDLVFSPTSTWDLAERIILLLEAGAPPGVYHGANAGSCSWFGFAQSIFKLAGVDADLVPRRTGADEVARPRCSVLVDTKSAPLGLPPMRGWEDALRWYLDHRPAKARDGVAGVRG